MHSAAGIMHDNFRLSNLDYGNVMDCAFILERDVRAYEKILRLAAFNVFAHNRDDHSKNISFLMDENGNWKVVTIEMSNLSHWEDKRQDIACPKDKEAGSSVFTNQFCKSILNIDTNKLVTVRMGQGCLI
jgi:hypothetical protein